MSQHLFRMIEKIKPHLRGPRKKLNSTVYQKKFQWEQNVVWTLRHRKVFSLNPDYTKEIPDDIVKKHQAIWKRISPKVKNKTLKVCYNISQCANPDIVPEEIFAARIEPALNRHPQADFLSNKAIYEKWFGMGIFPKCLLLKLDGQFYDTDLQIISQNEVHRILETLDYPVVFKPCMYSCGGQDVYFPGDRQTLLGIMKERDNFVIQGKIEQHPFFAALNPDCLNTQRVCTYRSVKDNSVHVLNVAQRIGRIGTLDNETDGGIVRYVNDDGVLNDYAVEKYGQKFTSHPDYKIPFDQITIPDFEGLKKLAIQITKSLPFVRLASLDMCLDKKNKWRIIEINLTSQTIRFSQYAGYPFFGRFTKEVIDYCEKHPYQW